MAVGDCNGAIYGIVSEEGLVKAGNPVILMDHSTLLPIARTVTDDNGGYVFNNLNPDKSDYMVFTVDNNDPKKNALIKDYVQPIQTANGVMNGNFWGMVDALAPDHAVAVFRSAGTNDLIAWDSGRMVRLGGIPVVYTNDYGTVNNFRTDLRPVPTSNNIMGADTINTLVGWANMPFNWYGYDNRDLSHPRSSDHPHLSFCIFNKMNGNAATYSVCNNLTAATDTESALRIRARMEYTFYKNDGNTHYPRQTMFNVCFETNGDLRLKWMGTDYSRNNVLVKAGLPNVVDGDFYMVVVRYGAIGTPFYVDITNCTTGATERITTGNRTIGVWTGKEAGSQWADGPRRCGIMISGALNVAAGSNNGSSNASTYEGAPWTSAVKAEYGPLMYWNRVLADKEVDDLIKSAVDTTTTWRSQPRFLSEIMQHGPTVYLPGDEYPGPLNRNCAQGYKKPVRTSRRLNLNVLPKLTGRRRNVIVPGGGYILDGMTVDTDTRFAFSFVWTRNYSSGEMLLNCENWNSHSTENDVTSRRILYLNSDTNGKVRFYMYDGTLDFTFTGARAIEVGETALITIVSDSYYNLRVRMYINGVQADSRTTTQQYGGYSGRYDTSYSLNNQIALMMDCNKGGRGHSMRDREYSRGNTVSDFVFWNHMLNDAEILEIYNAWATAVGPDSHA